MIREANAQWKVERAMTEAAMEPTSREMVSIVDLLGVIALELAALNDQLARDHNEGSPVRVAEL